MVDEVLSLHVVNVDVGAVVVVADVVVADVVVAVVVVVVLMRAAVCERTPDADVAVVGPDAVGVAVAVADVDEVVDVEMRLENGVITQTLLLRRYVPHMKGEVALNPPPVPPAQWSQTALLGPQMPGCQYQIWWSTEGGP